MQAVRQGEAPGWVWKGKLESFITFMNISSCSGKLSEPQVPTCKTGGVISGSWDGCSEFSKSP